MKYILAPKLIFLYNFNFVQVSFISSDETYSKLIDEIGLIFSKIILYRVNNYKYRIIGLT